MVERTDNGDPGHATRESTYIAPFTTVGVLNPTSGASFASTLRGAARILGETLVGPTSSAECKRGGWKRFNDPSFKNQGDCVSYVATNGTNHGAG